MQEYGLAKRRLRQGALRVVGIDSPREQSPNNRSPDGRDAQSPKSTALQIVKLWVSIGLGAAAERAQWSSHGFHHRGQPITACQMWQHRRSPTSNHSYDLQPLPAEANPRVSGLVRPLFSPLAGSISSRILAQPASPICSGLTRNRLGPLACRRWGSIEVLDVAASIASTRPPGVHLALIGPASASFVPTNLQRQHMKCNALGSDQCVA